MPPTFQDAVVITMKLGFQYLWIDSLCIIQNSPEDWNREAATMAYVYGNATLTICADAAANSLCGIFKSANDRPGIAVRLPANSLQNSFEWDIYLKARPQANDRYFHIGYRAWVLQECLLSPRVIIYKATQVKWSCRTAEEFERGGDDESSLGVVGLEPTIKSLLFPTTGSTDGDDKLTRTLAPTRIETTPFKPKDHSDYASQHQELLFCWYKIIQKYAPCKITKAEDRLPAIAGVVKRISALTGFSYLAKLWLEDIVHGLSWSCSGGPPQTSSEYLAPTWSWVCIRHVNPRGWFLVGYKYFEFAEDLKIEDINMKYATR